MIFLKTSCLKATLILLNTYLTIQKQWYPSHIYRYATRLIYIDAVTRIGVTQGNPILLGLFTTAIVLRLCQIQRTTNWQPRPEQDNVHEVHTSYYKMNFRSKLFQIGFICIFLYFRSITIIERQRNPNLKYKIPQNITHTMGRKRGAEGAGGGGGSK